MPKKYPEEFIKQVVVSYRNGMPIQELCQMHRIAQRTLFRWMREYGADAEGHTQIDYKALKKENTRIVHILQIIRLFGIISYAPHSKRLKILADLHTKFDPYSVSELCGALDIAKGTFYNHIFRKADRTKYLQEQQELRLQAQRVLDDNKQRYGAEKIRASLAESGINVSRKRIRTVMQELGLVSIRENAKRNYKKWQEYLQRNTIKQNFKAKSMNKAWVSDITYFKIKDYAVYLCVIIDQFSRRGGDTGFSKREVRIW